MRWTWSSGCLRSRPFWTAVTLCRRDFWHRAMRKTAIRMDQSLKRSSKDPAALVASAKRALRVEQKGLQMLNEAMDGTLGDAFVQAFELIRSTRGRVILSGMGKSGHIARKIAATLASTGTPALFVHAAETSHGDLGMITSDDVLLVLSTSGETEDL